MRFGQVKVRLSTQAWQRPINFDHFRFSVTWSRTAYARNDPSCSTCGTLQSEPWQRIHVCSTRFTAGRVLVRVQISVVLLRSSTVYARGGFIDTADVVPVPAGIRSPASVYWPCLTHAIGSESRPADSLPVLLSRRHSEVASCGCSNTAAAHVGSERPWRGSCAGMRSNTGGFLKHCAHLRWRYPL